MRLPSALSPLGLAALLLFRAAHASVGDRLPEFKECVQASLPLVKSSIQSLIPPGLRARELRRAFRLYP
jgi:hypothetical protein